MSEELKPCPFCGGKADEGLLKTGEGNYRNIIYCRDCGAAVDAVFSEDEPRGGGKWNRRTIPPAASAGDEVERALRLAIAMLEGVLDGLNDLGVRGGPAATIHAQLPSLRAALASDASREGGDG